jgi:hypothetical protein
LISRKTLFDLHPAAVINDGVFDVKFLRRQIGGQDPGLFLAMIVESNQSERVPLLGSEKGGAEIAPGSRLDDQPLKGTVIELVVDVGVPLEPDDVIEVEQFQVVEQIDLAKTPVGKNHDLSCSIA